MLVGFCMISLSIFYNTGSYSYFFFSDLLSGKKRLVPNRNTNNKPQAHTTGKKLKPMTIAELQSMYPPNLI